MTTNDPIKFKFVFHDNRRGYSYPITPETVYATLGVDRYNRLTGEARIHGTHELRYRGNVWVATRWIP